MSRSQRRDSSGRFANRFARLIDTAVRSGGEAHQRTVLDSTEPLSWMAAPEEGTRTDKYLYAVAVGAGVSWTDERPPTRHVHVQYVTPNRERVVTREARGRLGCSDGRVHVASVDWSTVPLRIAVPLDETDELDVSAGTYEAFGDALHAHEEVA